MDKLIFLFALVGLALANSDVTPPLQKGIDLSTMKLLKATYDEVSDKNIVSSPLSLMTLLALYNEGAGPAGQEELSKFLGGTNREQTSDSFKQLSDLFFNMDADYFTVANKVAVSNQYELNDTFARSARAFHSEFDTLDFAKPEEAAAEINKWAAEKTKDHIKDAIDKDLLSADIVAALFNVIYFSGHWHVPFKAEETQNRNFHLSRDATVPKPMMHLIKPLFYTASKELDAKLVELPYKEYGFRMVVVLPNEVDGLPAVLEKAADKGLLSEVAKLQPSGRVLELLLPKFEIKSNLDFEQILPKVGVSKIFTEGANGIAKNIAVKVSKAFQKAFIKVDEEGATAGAFTGVVITPLSSNYRPPPPLQFFVDHPFLYLILYNDTILFAGTYTN